MPRLRLRLIRASGEMKQISGHSDRVLDAAADSVFRLLESIEGYPNWHPQVVRQVTVLARDDQQRASRVTATLQLAAGPLHQNVETELAVEIDPPRSVRLTRIGHDRADRERFEAVWQLEPVAAGTRIALSIEARLDVPRLIPVGGAGQAMAASFVAAAARALEPPSTASPPASPARRQSS